MPPKPRRTGLLIRALPILVLAGCSTSTPIAYRDLASSRSLVATKSADEPFRYLGGDLDWRSYTKVMIDPVVIYAGADGQFGSVAPEDRRIVADYLQSRFSGALRSRFAIVAAPDSATLRLRLTPTGLETSTPVLSTVTHIAPLGLALNTGLEATDRNGTFFGSVSYAVELMDAPSGRLLYAYVTKQTPDALDVTASLGTLDAARTGVRIGAAHLVADLGRLQNPTAEAK